MSSESSEPQATQGVRGDGMGSSQPAAEPASHPPAEPGGGLFETASDAEATARAVAAAAPVTIERADQSVLLGLEPAVRPAMRALLLSLADNKYVLGRRYAEWCTGAPMLESAVAAAAMAQDELGHARSFYPLLRGFGADAQAMEDKGWQDRPTNAVTCLDQPFGAWTQFVAANLLVDTAFSVLLGAAVDSPYEPLRQRARKISQEEAPHWVHASGWLQRLADQPALFAALAAMWDDALTFFGLPDDSTLAPLAAAGHLRRGPDALRDDLRGRLEPVLSRAGLADSLLGRPLPWPRWDPATRRLRPA